MLPLDLKAEPNPLQHPHLNKEGEEIQTES